MTGADIARRLVDELGVEFPDGVPTRAHTRRHGQLVDTFLVLERTRRGRTELDESVGWRLNGGKGISVVLHDTPRKLAKARLAVELDDVAGYGVLAVYDADAREARLAAEGKAAEDSAGDDEDAEDDEFT